MLRFRLKPAIWIEALRRRAEAKGAYVMVLQKGDQDGGSVSLIVENSLQDSALYTAQTQMDGTRGWHCENGLSAYDLQKRITSLKRMDQDMWIIEITNSNGQNFLDEPILDA